MRAMADRIPNGIRPEADWIPAPIQIHATPRHATPRNPVVTKVLKPKFCNASEPASAGHPVVAGLGIGA